MVWASGWAHLLEWLSLGSHRPVGELVGQPWALQLPQDSGLSTRNPSHRWREGLSSPGSGPGPGASGLRLNTYWRKSHPPLSSLPDPHLPRPHSWHESSVTHPTPMQLGHPGAWVWQRQRSPTPGSPPVSRLPSPHTHHFLPLTWNIPSSARLRFLQEAP